FARGKLGSDFARGKLGSDFARGKLGSDFAGVGNLTAVGSCETGSVSASSVGVSSGRVPPPLGLGSGLIAGTTMASCGGRGGGDAVSAALRAASSCSNTAALFAVNRLMPSRTPGVLNGLPGVVHDSLTTHMPRNTGVPSCSCTEKEVSRPGGLVLSVDTKN